MDPLLGTIMIWPMNWAPVDWAICNGAPVPVNQNQALYSLLGNNFGGDQTAFNLPNLSGNVPIGMSQMFPLGSKGGSLAATGTLNGGGVASIGVDNLPAHNHTATFTPSGGSASVEIAIPASTAAGDSNTPSNTAVPGMPPNIGPNQIKVYNSGTPNTTLKPFSISVPGGGGTVAVATTGKGQPLPVNVAVPYAINVIQPYQVVNYIICTNGIYPTRP